jgi:hypothetical protein
MASPENPPIPSIPSARKRTWIFIEHPVFWGGVGVIIGSAAATVKMGIMFGIGWFVIAIAVFRVPLFQGKAVAKWLGNGATCVVIAVALFGLWRVTPKPKEPPTLDEITTSFKSQMRETKSETQATQGAATSVLPPVSSAKKSHKAMAAKDIAPTPDSTPKTDPPTQQSPPNYASLTIFQKSDISTREDAPFHIILTIQTTVEMPSLKLLVKCDGPLVEAHPHFTGSEIIMMSGGGVSNADPTLIGFFYGSASPPFGPSNPLVIDVWSKAFVKCSETRTF